jgi:hypothetical protein
MPKRRASEDEDDSEYSAASAGSDNDTYVADKRTSKKQRKTATGGTAARRAPTAKASESAASSSTQALVHASTTHVLSDEDAEGAASALLDWFAGVYDARGMPWRKRFDPTWTAEQRGQRAYEVRDPPFSPPQGPHTCRRSGCRKSCCNRPKLRPSYLTTTGGWISAPSRRRPDGIIYSPYHYRFPTLKDLVRHLFSSCMRSVGLLCYRLPRPSTKCTLYGRD